jgi:hypothetical protein
MIYILGGVLRLVAQRSELGCSVCRGEAQGDHEGRGFRFHRRQGSIRRAHTAAGRYASEGDKQVDAEEDPLRRDRYCGC